MGVPHPIYQTYTYGTTDPGTSRLFVPLGDVLRDPTINGSDPTAIPYTVSPPIPLVPSIIESSTGTISNCPLVPASSVAWRHANGTTGDDENGDKPVITNVLNGQSYTLFPNPSNGTISLKQEIIDQRTLSGAIYNALGQKVFDGELNFESGTTQVKLNNPTPGMYLLQLTDENGQRFTLRFTVE